MYSSYQSPELIPQSCKVQRLSRKVAFRGADGVELDDGRSRREGRSSDTSDDEEGHVHWQIHPHILKVPPKYQRRYKNSFPIGILELSGSAPASTSNASLFIANVFSWVCGTSLIVIGLIGFLGASHVYWLAEGTAAYDTACALAITVGTLSMLLSCFRCATDLSNRQVSSLYVIVSVFLLMLEVTTGILFALEKGKSDVYFRNANVTFYVRYRHDEDTRQKVDHLQQDFRCCGLRHYGEWFEAKLPNASSTLPVSCCSPLMTNLCQRNATKWTKPFAPLGVFPKPCLPTFTKRLGDFLILAKATCITVITMHFIFLLISTAIYVAPFYFPRLPWAPRPFRPPQVASDGTPSGSSLAKPSPALVPVST